MTADAARALVLRHTTEARATLVPELRLRLLTHECPLWHADEAALAAAGLERLPYWAFAWPGGQVLARWLLDHPEFVRGRRVLDFGAGGAIEGVAAARAGAAHVRCVDIDPLAEVAARENAALNGVHLEALTGDEVGDLTTRCDVVLAGDALYQPALAARVRPWLAALAARGAEVLVGDPGRVDGVLEGLEVLDERLAPFDGDVRALVTWPTRVARWRPAQ